LAADFTGQGVSVPDGDTIEVLHNTYPERVRLSGIDCPKKGSSLRPESQARRFGSGFSSEPSLVLVMNVSLQHVASTQGAQE